MKIIDYYKNQPLICQILDGIFILCFIYEVILLIATGSLNYSITAIMLVTLGITSLIKLRE